MLAADLAKALNLPMPKPGFIGDNPAKPEIVVAPGGGADLIYLPSAAAESLARNVVQVLMAQTYVSGVFVNDQLGKCPGALAMSDVGLMGTARTPQPAIIVSFRSYSVCGQDLQCAVQVGDSAFLTGQGDHGSFNRATTRNFMAAIGPDFKEGFVDPLPVSNADIAPTLAHIMGLELPTRGKLTGRVITEALPGGALVNASRKVIASDPGPGGAAQQTGAQRLGRSRSGSDQRMAG